MANAAASKLRVIRPHLSSHAQFMSMSPPPPTIDAAHAAKCDGNHGKVLFLVRVALTTVNTKRHTKRRVDQERGGLSPAPAARFH